MHSTGNYYVSKLLPLIAEAQVHAISNPLINITLQGRHDNHPRRRGMTRAPELMAHGVTVAFDHDCVMDPWYGLGSGDMLEVAAMGSTTSSAGASSCASAFLPNPARARVNATGSTPAQHQLNTSSTPPTIGGPAGAITIRLPASAPGYVLVWPGAGRR
jgi:cytosine/adenosine deaminase-related metal-dependent hydrolase